MLIIFNLVRNIYIIDKIPLPISQIYLKIFAQDCRSLNNKKTPNFKYCN